jgi:hypothetical protein
MPPSSPEMPRDQFVNAREFRNASSPHTISRFPAHGGRSNVQCRDDRALALYESGARTHVASKILEAATRRESSVDDLQRIGKRALATAPTMWR